MTDTTTELPSVAQRVADTNARVQRLKGERATTALSATRGDKKAQERLPGIVAELQAAELELSILADAGKEERRQALAQMQADQIAGLFAGIDESAALVPALDKACAEAHDALTRWLDLTAHAEGLGQQIRDRMWEVARFMNPRNETAEPRPHRDTVSALCGTQGTEEMRKDNIASTRRWIEVRRADLKLHCDRNIPSERQAHEESA